MASTSSGSGEPVPAPAAAASESLPAKSALNVAEKPPDDTSKLRMFLGILRKFIGVADIASVRFSLPAQLLEPTPNLEYWNYLDQPNTAASSLRSKKTPGASRNPSPPAGPELGGTAVDKTGRKVKVSYLTEQTSHHPPVSAFFVDCPEKGLTARGFDQISAKFTGTSVKVVPGEHNLGIFITLSKRDNEQYQLTHPDAHLGGLLRGSLNVTVGDQCFITCPQSKLKTILHYHEEGWLGKTQNKVEGVVFRYDPENDTKTTIKSVSDRDVLARISGNWKEKLFFSLGPKGGEPTLLIDLAPLSVAPKLLPPPSAQLPNESLRFWSGVTEAINARQYARATALKQELEENQRAKAKEREDANAEWVPRFFVGATTPLGKPELTEEGREVLRRLQEDRWDLSESTVTGA
ncbi:oxysterol binding protein-like protein [Diplocarpon rosae]|nr:oxysterol binding protein-like protein [Diplocarpon rosae]